MSRTAFFLLIVLPIAAILAVVGTLDYQDAQQQAVHCQHMVEQGHWPTEVCHE